MCINIYILSIYLVLTVGVNNSRKIFGVSAKITLFWKTAMVTDKNAGNYAFHKCVTPELQNNISLLTQ